ncbi:helix-turn-helix domain-containing protein [Lentzea albidocapillata]|uniref:Helix-turn-helix domain-containing protein n=1 Tax=Lentzea albidocapillata TaxID=40571 RepID=A0A1W2BB67_9PSEU|nr:helix-turn-helix transcriptional regulator [Lentzea albidocapillata]SMC70020.1 Helix-turn-helix domain-containing protein [Lentzea albidocapillata]
MAVVRDGHDLAGFLSELKRRSGLSYAELARRTYTSSSALHRYCSGHSTPADYQVLARIGLECGASDVELNELLRRWRDVNDGPPQPPVEHPAPARHPAPVNQRPAARRRTGVGVLIAVALLLVPILSASSPDTGPARAEPITAPSWVTHPSPVSAASFGVTLNSTTGAMPSFRIGSVRLWDSRTRWANLQPRRDRFDWATLDRLVDGSQRAGLPALFVAGGTPEWAAPNSPKTAYDDDSRTGAPDDLADWDRFVRAVAERYRGRIEAYELWAYANDTRFYSGSVETLVAMTRQAAAIVRSIDGKAVVVCPSMGRLWHSAGRDFLLRFAELGGYQHCDAAGVKLHQRDAADPPETLMQLITEIDRVMHAAGVHPPLWNTGTTYDLPLQKPLAPQRSADYAMRFYLTGLYGRKFGLARMYFYNWGSSRLPLVLQAEGTAPTEAAIAVETLQRWLAGARLRSCGQGLAAGLPGNVWQCEFIGETNRRLVIRWTHAGTADTTAGPGAESVTRADGATTALRVGDPVEITESPTLIGYR